MKPSLLLLFLSFCVFMLACSKGNKAENTVLSDLAITVDSTENRPFSFTNKLSGYWVDFSKDANHPEWSWFEGWTISRMKILPGYVLYLNAQKLDAAYIEEATVQPDFAAKSYVDGSAESIWLYDYADLMSVEVFPSSSSPSDVISLAFKANDLELLKNDAGILYFRSIEPKAGVVAIGSFTGDQSLSFQNGIISQNVGDKTGFFFAYSPNPDEALSTILQAREKYQEWQNSRSRRMKNFIDYHVSIKTDDANFDKAIQWIALNLDQLVTQQQGTGIYAGLPWFNDYWGRDLFISLSGASLVNGQFDTAKKILLSFAQLQDTNPSSPTYGRIPNRARPNELLYNTTDGTPRFVSSAMDYVKYSGDLSIVDELYPAIKRSVEGNLKLHTDSQGFLTHDDADTWMDAKLDGKTPWSPRGNRANDIQALWVSQLEAAAWFADQVNDRSNATKWLNMAADVRRKFNNTFIISGAGYLADHINKDGSLDRQFRPNQLFALNLLQDEALKASIAKMSWGRLVYPWGVSSLDSRDPNFHPYHLATEFYPKDSAYHNGAIWLWLNGIAMQRLIEFNQQDIAFKLFKNMNELALTRAGVGGLPENMDAIPKAGKGETNITGTFLQAWSNAEQIRVLYDSFIGFKPDLLKDQIRLKPHLPSEINQLNTKLHVGEGYIDFSFDRSSQHNRYVLVNKTQLQLELIIQLPDFDEVDLELPPNYSVIFDEKPTRTNWLVKNQEGITTESFIKTNSGLQKSLNEEWDAFFKGLGFAKPDSSETYETLK